LGDGGSSPGGDALQKRAGRPCIKTNSSADAANESRSCLLIAIREVVDGWDLTQAEAAKQLGVTQPRINDLLHGRIDKFSLDALMNLATAADLSIEWRVLKPAA
jgi:predicted XRE-type DNA-binding protein